MMESLGSGFDRIRATLMSPTNIESHMPSSPSTGRSPDNSEPVDEIPLGANTPDSSEPPETGPSAPTIHGTLDAAPSFAVPHGTYVTTPEEADWSVTGAPSAVSAERLSSDSEMAEGPEPGQAVGFSVYMNGSADLESFLAHLAQSTPGGNNVAISDDTENENGGGLVQDCDSLIYDAPSPFVDSEDGGSDLDDTRKFYLGDDDYDMDATRRFHDWLQMDYRDAYRHFGYQPMHHRPDLSGFPMPAGSGNQNSFESEELSDGDTHFGAPMQGSSKTTFFFFFTACLPMTNMVDFSS